MSVLDALRVRRRWYRCVLASLECPKFFDKFGYQISLLKKSIFMEFLIISHDIDCVQYSHQYRNILATQGISYLLYIFVTKRSQTINRSSMSMQNFISDRLGMVSERLEHSRHQKIA